MFTLESVTYRAETARDAMPADDYAVLVAACIAEPCYCRDCDARRIAAAVARYEW